MKNHFHLLVQVGNIPLSEVMHNLTFRYSQKINRKYMTTGHLFQGRYKAILVQDGLYFTRLLRYIHRNPIRAGIVSHPGDYSWSSHNAYIDRNSINWITKDFGLSKFANKRGEAIERYSAYMFDGESEGELKELRSNFKDGHVLGDDDFLDLVRNQSLIDASKSLSIETIMNVVCKEFHINTEILLSKNKSRKISYARALIAKMGIEEGGISMTVLGKLLNRDQSTISRLVDNFEEKYEKLSSEFLDIEGLTDLALLAKTT